MDKIKLLYGSIITLGIIVTYFIYDITANNMAGKDSIPSDIILPLAGNFGQIGIEEFSLELGSGNTVLIDIRTPDELQEYGVISDEQSHIIFGTEGFSKQILELDKNKKYLIYCWHGNRSAVTREFMRENGFKWVKDLAGGIDDWNKVE